MKQFLFALISALALFAFGCDESTSNPTSGESNVAFVQIVIGDSLRTVYESDTTYSISFWACSVIGGDTVEIQDSWASATAGSMAPRFRSAFFVKPQTELLLISRTNAPRRYVSTYTAVDGLVIMANRP